MQALLLIAGLLASCLAQNDPTQPVIIRLRPQPIRPRFLEEVRKIVFIICTHVSNFTQYLFIKELIKSRYYEYFTLKYIQQESIFSRNVFKNKVCVVGYFKIRVSPPRAVQPPIQTSNQGSSQTVSQPTQPSIQQTVLPPSPPPAAQQPVFQQTAPPGNQQFIPREQAAVPPPPPVTIPPDVQNQLIKFFGLDSFGIPGLTGNHPNGFAGAVQLRAAGIPVQGLPADHINGNDVAKAAPTHDVLAQANPNFQNQLNQLVNEAHNPGPYHAPGSLPLPSEQPGENGLIGLLSTSIRKLVKESSGGNSPTHAGLPRIPGIPLLPGGIPRNSQGQIDVVNLIGSITLIIMKSYLLEVFSWYLIIILCVIIDGGLTKNDKTATFTALKIYREGSEFGPVRYSIGYAFRGGNKDAMLQLHSSETSDAQPLLVRDPDTFKTKYQTE
uniref:Ameloblastin n=1 Tax=Heterorhabditis bacteriophora TaxID=37862 RepID=A0A1I7WX96_HETBA